MEQLLKKTFAFHKEDVRHNILLPFVTGKDFDRLVVCLHYYPEIISDPEIVRPAALEAYRRYYPDEWQSMRCEIAQWKELQNFVTFSLDKDGKYIGCRHRHGNRHEVVISAKGSDPGFAPCPASCGSWRLVLHVQAVITEPVRCTAAVFGLEGGESPDDLPSL